MNYDERAQAAFDAMANDPEVWLTHGMPSCNKERRIVAIIAAAIAATVQDELIQESFHDFAVRLLDMERARIPT